MPLPFSLARPLPRSPLRSADGHRNRDAIVPRYLHISPSPIGNRYSVADSVRSLRLPSAPPALRASAQSDPKNREFGTNAAPFFLWLTPCRALRSVPIMGTEIVTAHSVRLFRPRFARPYDSPLLWFHHLPKDPIVRVFFLSSRADGEITGVHPR